MQKISEQNVWLNIDKPIGYSSAKVVAIVKKMTKAKKVGHGGTLDPLASGILPVALNKATKTSQNLMDAKKKYYFRIKFGEFRDTDDAEGKIIKKSESRPKINDLINIIPQFIGKITQTPSQFSAIKINGKRAYELARKGVDFEMPKREVEIYSLKLISLSKEFVEFEAECSKGTYIRSLARDICKEAGCCGYVEALIRLRVGKFLYDSRISLDLLKQTITYGGSFSDGSLLCLSQASKKIDKSDDLEAQFNI